MSMYCLRSNFIQNDELRRFSFVYFKVYVYVVLASQSIRYGYTILLFQLPSAHYLWPVAIRW